MIIESTHDWSLVTGVVYKCDKTDRGFMCLLWVAPTKIYFIEHGNGFLHGGSEIVKIIRDKGTVTIIPNGTQQMLDAFMQIRTSSATRLVWSKL